MHIATGKYITFVDSDDYLRTDAYKILLQLIEEKNADVVCYSYKNVSEDGTNLNWYEPKLKNSGKYILEEQRRVYFLIHITLRDFAGTIKDRYYSRITFALTKIKLPLRIWRFYLT